MNADDIWLLDVGHVLGGGLFLIFTYIRINQLKRVTLLHLSSGFFIVCTCLFFPLIKYVYPEWSLTDQSTAFRSLAASAIFIVMCVGADLIFYRRCRPRVELRLVPTASSNLVLMVVFLFGLIGFVKFFFIGRAVDHLGEVYAAVKAGGDYYEARISVAADLQRQTGLGVAHSQMAVSGVFPAVIGFCFVAAIGKKKVFYWSLAVWSFVLSLLIVSVTMHRQAVLFAVLIPVLMWFFLRKSEFSEQRMLRLLRVRGSLIIVIVLLGGGAMAYSWTYSQSLGRAIAEAFNRTFVDPGMVGTWYYSAFPEVFHFRGWENIFFMPSELSDVDTSTREVAKYVTQLYSMNANSNFLATAYSGAGLPGCMVITAIFVLAVAFIDTLFERTSPQFRVLNILANFGGIISLPNAPLGVALTTSGFGYPALFLWLLWWFSKRDHCLTASEKETPRVQHAQ